MRKKMKEMLNLFSVEKSELVTAKAGNCCSCSCYYAGSGGSSTTDNGMANYGGNMSSIDGKNNNVYCDEDEMY